MPVRKIPLVTGEFYHVYNQGIDLRTAFSNKREFDRSLLTLWYYSYADLSLKLSNYFALGTDQQLSVRNTIVQKPLLVTVIAFCLMNNHFHVLLRQEQDGGISEYLGNFQNSYIKFYNARRRRRGSLFLNPFRSVRIETDEQLLHVARYIHLNPFSNYLLQTLEELFVYPYSSLSSYFTKPYNEKVVETTILEAYFTSKKAHRTFIEDQADYQRTLEGIKHLTFEDSISSSMD